MIFNELRFQFIRRHGKDACLRAPVSYCDLSRVQLVPCTSSEGDIAEELARHNMLRVTITIFDNIPTSVQRKPFDMFNCRHLNKIYMDLLRSAAPLLLRALLA